MCAFSSTICLLLKVLCLIDMSKLLLGKDKSESGETEVRQVLCTYAEAAKQQIIHAKALKYFDGCLVCCM